MNNSLKIIYTSNTDNNYIGSFTKKENKIIKKHCKGYTLNLFSGKSNIGDIRVDYSYGNIQCDVFEFLMKNNEYFNTVIIDAPYNQKYANNYQKLNNTPKQFIIFADTNKTSILFNWIITSIKPEIIILKSWNYYIVKGYKLKKGYLCYNGGYRKSTILLIMENINF